MHVCTFWVFNRCGLCLALLNWSETIQPGCEPSSPSGQTSLARPRCFALLCPWKAASGWEGSEKQENEKILFKRKRKKKASVSFPTAAKSHWNSPLVMGFPWGPSAGGFCLVPSVLYGFLPAVLDAPLCWSVRQTPLQREPLNFPVSSFVQLVGEVVAVIASAAWSPLLPHAAELWPSWPVLYLTSGSCLIADTRNKIAFLGKKLVSAFSNNEIPQNGFSKA